MYGFADKTAYHRRHGAAPKLYYFDIYYSELEKMAAWLRPGEGKSWG